jgi:hypothetical protein
VCSKGALWSLNNIPAVTPHYRSAGWGQLDLLGGSIVGRLGGRVAVGTVGWDPGKGGLCGTLGSLASRAGFIHPMVVSCPWGKGWCRGSLYCT